MTLVKAGKLEHLNELFSRYGKRLYNYFSYGSACSEVEVDVLTGDWHALRVDIVMDVGNPINPAIDIGQVSAYSPSP